MLNENLWLYMVLLPNSLRILLVRSDNFAGLKVLLDILWLSAAYTLHYCLITIEKIIFQQICVCVCVCARAPICYCDCSAYFVMYHETHVICQLSTHALQNLCYLFDWRRSLLVIMQTFACHAISLHIHIASSFCLQYQLMKKKNLNFCCSSQT